MKSVLFWLCYCEFFLPLIHAHVQWFLSSWPVNISFLTNNKTYLFCERAWSFWLTGSISFRNCVLSEPIAIRTVLYFFVTSNCLYVKTKSFLASPLPRSPLPSPFPLPPPNCGHYISQCHTRRDWFIERVAQQSEFSFFRRAKFKFKISWFLQIGMLMLPTTE